MGNINNTFDLHLKDDMKVNLENFINDVSTERLLVLDDLNYDMWIN